ncbi:MAG: hypothetical protein ACYC0X_08305 [Pirellulaceae bacterium]
MRMLLHLSIALAALCSVARPAEPINIANRRELLLDGLLVGQLEGGAQRVFHRPVPREIVIRFDRPWEGNTSSGCTVFRDGDRYRMYYRATQGEDLAGYWCYAESGDGIEWTRPVLGLVDYKGSRENNILSRTLPDTGNPVVFRDENPAAAPDSLYKAVAIRYRKHAGEARTADAINEWWATIQERTLTIWKSPDGIHWTQIQEEGIFRNEGYFDSQNVAFWDPNIQAYRAYFREICPDDAHLGGIRRDIKTGTSADFVHWSPGTLLHHVRPPEAQYYTNVIRPYHRAPHLYLGFPGMYDDRPWSPAMEQLPDREMRARHVAAWNRPGPLSDVQLIWSRDGVTFERAPATFLTPGPERSGAWTYSDNVLWHLVETASVLEGAAPELTLYAQEFYYLGTVQLRRYTLRLDGFASIHAPIDGGELITPPLLFQGSRLWLNFATSAFGSLRVELQDAEGQPLPGFTLADSLELYGDTVAREARWKNDPDLSAHAGRPVRLRFAMRDADLYSIKFERAEVDTPISAVKDQGK